MEFMNLYIDQGQLGEFVTGILLADRKGREEAARKEEEDRLWLAYIHSMTGKSFHDWKRDLKQKQAGDTVILGMSDGQITAVKQHAQEILKRISP